MNDILLSDRSFRRSLMTCFVALVFSTLLGLITRTQLSSVFEIAKTATPVRSVAALTIMGPNITKTSSFWKENGLPEGLRLCRLPDLPPVGQPSDPPNLYPSELIMKFPCAGDPYDAFINGTLFPLIRDLYAAQPNLTWGRRPSLLPPSPDGTPRSILLTGNSHTRQQAYTLLGQYQEDVVSGVDLQDYDLIYPAMAKKYQLRDKTTVYVVTNHLYTHSPTPYQNLEDILKIPLTKLDAIVLGTFNDYIPVFKTAALWLPVINYTKEIPQHQVDLDLYPKAFQVKDLADVYQGPIIWSPMFGHHYTQPRYDADKQIGTLREQQGRSNLYSIAQRLEDQQHCGSDAKRSAGQELTIVGTCRPNDKTGGTITAHRCLGTMGGETDLIAYDIVEALYSSLSPEVI